eukprot:Nitzschia sp. Nitz4//scaffold167_size49223//7158//8276//NITZ4_007031-RA/size49223-processed-gene-0.30-mRNA-1//-1//CDS//3329538263//3593//frame0
MASDDSQQSHPSSPSLCLRFDCPDGRFLGFFDEDEVLALTSISPFFRECVEAIVPDGTIRSIQVLEISKTYVYYIVRACIDGCIQLVDGMSCEVPPILEAAELIGIDLCLCNKATFTATRLHKEKIPHFLDLWKTSRKLIAHTVLSQKQWKLCLENDILLMPESSDNMVLKVLRPTNEDDGIVPASTSHPPVPSSNFVFHLYTKGLGLTDVIMRLRDILKSECVADQYQAMGDADDPREEKFSVRVNRGEFKGSRPGCLHEHLYQDLRESKWLSAPCSVLKDLFVDDKQRKKNELQFFDTLVEFQVAYPSPDTLGRFLSIASETSVQFEMVLESNVFRCFGNMPTIAFIVQYMADYSDVVELPRNDFVMAIH